ncbi:ATP-NAD kinase PpnK-type [Penicillium capsulatum]|uniref:ATP-NAD kinase PpnK-type n=1 Tax=Penicillium capsulatum TaxID=69766 RepID=A0A9W9HLQ6_9EURO|nr:ATP-NAD kinase PpnK-type [Penicillium capsulatum]KAJ6112584.1 ATP-NAD kinase PpnK-type [Penicillium capsulatum]
MAAINIRTATVTDGILTCTSSPGDEIQIQLDDIVGVVQIPEHDRGYNVLFVERGGPDDVNFPGRLTGVPISSLPSSLSHLMTEVPSYLQHDAPVQVVVSTRSGTGAASAVFQHIVRPFLAYLGLNHEVYETQSSQTILELSQSRFLKHACAGKPQTILLLSGDGGLIDIVDVFYKSSRSIEVPPNIALIPCGTGNAMASSIGLRNGPASGLVTLLRGTPCSVPILTAKVSPGGQLVIDEGHGRAPIDVQPDLPHHTIYGAVVASWGLHATLVADSDTSEYRKFGSERFQMAAKELLYPSDNTEPHRFQGKITLTTSSPQTGELREETLAAQEHMYVLATLVPRLEKEFLISPASEPLGGQLRLLQFGPVPAAEAMRLMTLAYQGGQHVAEPSVTYTEVERVRIEFQEEQERWRRVCIDGKIVAIEAGGWLEICKEPRELLYLIYSKP